MPTKETDPNTNITTTVEWHFNAQGQKVRTTTKTQKVLRTRRVSKAVIRRKQMAFQKVCPCKTFSEIPNLAV
jgi:hypothetical protein